MNVSELMRKVGLAKLTEILHNVLKRKIFHGLVALQRKSTLANPACRLFPLKRYVYSHNSSCYLDY